MEGGAETVAAAGATAAAVRPDAKSAAKPAAKKPGKTTEAKTTEAKTTAAKTAQAKTTAAKTTAAKSLPQPKPPQPNLSQSSRPTMRRNGRVLMGRTTTLWMTGRWTRRGPCWLVQAVSSCSTPSPAGWSSTIAHAAMLAILAWLTFPERDAGGQILAIANPDDVAGCREPGHRADRSAGRECV